MSEKDFFPKKEDAKVRQEFEGSSGKSGMGKCGPGGPTMKPGPVQMFGTEGKGKKKK